MSHLRACHLIYPSSEKICTPYSIGRNISIILSKTYNVQMYDWQSCNTIIPRDGDLLIGHSHPLPFTIFKNSLGQKLFSQRIMIQPFSTYLPHTSYILNILPFVDKFLAITASFWEKSIKTSKFNKFSKKIFPINLGININDFPFVKTYIKKPQNRKILYIGNKNPCKNIDYLVQVAKKIGLSKFGSIGAVIPGFKNYGSLDFSKKESLDIIKEYDYLILLSYADACPTVVLEAMSWGLIPMTTQECGFVSNDGTNIIASNDCDAAVCQIKSILNYSLQCFKKIQRENLAILKKDYSWTKFEKVLQKHIHEKKYIKGRYRKNNIKTIFNDLVVSGSFLRPAQFKAVFNAFISNR